MVQPTISQMDQRQFQTCPTISCPGITNLNADMERQGWVTTARSQVVDEASFHASPWYQSFCRPSTATITSCPCSRRCAHAARSNQDRPPTRHRPVRTPRGGMLKLLHRRDCAARWRRLTTEEHRLRDGLSKRLRESFDAAARRDKVKSKSAHRTRISGNRTVHDYVTRLYEHFPECHRVRSYWPILSVAGRYRARSR